MLVKRLLKAVASQRSISIVNLIRTYVYKKKRKMTTITIYDSRLEVIKFDHVAAIIICLDP